MNIDVGAYLASLDAILQKDNETVLYLDKKDQLILAWNDENGAADSFSGTEFKTADRKTAGKRSMENPIWSIRLSMISMTFSLCP